MRYAIISDIHANEQALKAVLADAAAKGAERVICLGDVVGYGPLPAETVGLTRSACDAVTAGNHDGAVSGKSGTDDFTGLAGDAVSRHREALSPDDISWLGNLPHVYEGDGFIACHGDFTDPSKFYYVEDVSDAEANFNTVDAELMFVGHTHVPALFLTGASGKVYRTEPQDFTLESGKRYIVNPGSVGYPRELNGKCFSSYVIYDSDEKTVTFHYLPLAISSVMQRGENPKIWGQTPKSLKRKIIFAISAAAGIIGILTACFLNTRVTVAAKDELVIREMTVPVTAELKSFRPNLVLDKGTDPVHLWITFKKADGTGISEWSRIVKDRCSRKLKIPAGTDKISISVRKTEAEDNPRISRLEPAAERD